MHISVHGTKYGYFIRWLGSKQEYNKLQGTVRGYSYNVIFSDFNCLACVILARTPTFKKVIQWCERFEKPWAPFESGGLLQKRFSPVGPLKTTKEIEYHNNKRRRRVPQLEKSKQHKDM